MEEELLETKSASQFSKKYKMGYSTARRKLIDLLKPVEILTTENKEKEVEDTIKQEEIFIQEYKMFENIKKIIVNVDELKNKGINFYIADSRKKISYYDKQFSDYRHALENSLETLSNEELIQISKNIGLLSRKRRFYKNEVEFLDNHRTETQGFLDFLKKIDEETRKLENQIYTPRVLKEEMNSIVIVSKNNDTLKDLEIENEKLKMKIFELEMNSEQVIPEDVKERLISLEKFNLKEERRKQRAKGCIVPRDCLKDNWKDLFNSKLDNLTRKEILKDCYAKYSGVDIREIKELSIWEKILPEYLYERKYFIK